MQYSFFAYHLTERFKLKDIQKVIPFEPLSINPDEIVYKLEKNSYIFLYRFGAMVFFNVPKDIQNREIDRITNTLDIQASISAHDEFLMETDSSESMTVSLDVLKCSKLNFDVIYLAALVLAQSASLDYFEGVVDMMLERSRKITKGLEETGKIQSKTRDLIRYIGFALTTKQEIVTKLYILDKPELTWEKPAYDKLYNQLSGTFELTERYRMLDYKFRMIQESLEIISDLLKTKREVYLELSIIFLIAIEILLFIYELFFK